MARPRYGEGDARAKERLVEAFWETLEEKPYEQMRVLEVCRRAGLNKNTFYYHFEGLPQLADAAIDGMMFRELARMATHGPESVAGAVESLLAQGGIQERFRHMSILLSDNGAGLQGGLADRIAAVWRDERESAGDGTSPQWETVAAYASGGVVNLMRHRNPQDYGDVLRTMAASPAIGAIIREVMGKGEG